LSCDRIPPTFLFSGGELVVLLPYFHHLSFFGRRIGCASTIFPPLVFFRAENWLCCDRIPATCPFSGGELVVLRPYSGHLSFFGGRTGCAATVFRPLVLFRAENWLCCDRIPATCPFSGGELVLAEDYSPQK
jgi:hypothetical protein